MVYKTLAVLLYTLVFSISQKALAQKPVSSFDDTAMRIHPKVKNFNLTWNKDSVTKVANAVFEGQMKAYQKDESSFDKRWVSGVLYNGLFDWAESTNNNVYFDFLNRIFNRFYWQLGHRMYHADDLCVAQAYLDMYARERKKEMMIPAQARIEWIIANPPADTIDITQGKSERWWWCDALYMAPPVFARLTTLTGDLKYLEFAHKEFLATYNHLYDRDEHLFFRDGRYLDTKDTNGTDVFWSRGNGWVLAGLAEMLKNLPEHDKKYRPFYEKLFREMSAKIASLQDNDGYWRSNLLNKDIYPMPETSGTGLFTYAIMYGINQGLLPVDQYLPVVQKGWNALVQAVDAEGKVGWTQLVAEKPGIAARKATKAYSTGSFLMVAAELNKYLKRSGLRDASGMYNVIDALNLSAPAVWE